MAAFCSGGNCDGRVISTGTFIGLDAGNSDVSRDPDCPNLGDCSEGRILTMVFAVYFGSVGQCRDALCVRVLAMASGSCCAYGMGSSFGEFDSGRLVASA